MAKSVKLADIAKEMGVSVVTVSKALSGQKGVSESMRERIIARADELGYVQPSAAKKQEKNVSYNLGVLIGEGYLGDYSFYLQMYQQVARSAVERGCFSILEVVSGQMEGGMLLPKIISENKADGVVVIGSLSEKYLNLLLKESAVPLIFMDFSDKKRATDCVISDSFFGGYYMTNYLIDMGHTRIAYVGTVGVTGSITDRYLGYMKALLERGIPFREDWVISDRKSASGTIGGDDYLKLPKDMPTAFFCNCDLTAGILINKLEKEGFRVPEDISVAGYDDYVYPGLCDTDITTYAVDISEMAAQTVNVLIKKISGASYRKGIHVVEGSLVVKNSVKKRR